MPLSGRYVDHVPLADDTGVSADPAFPGAGDLVLLDHLDDGGGGVADRGVVLLGPVTDMPTNVQSSCVVVHRLWLSDR